MKHADLTLRSVLAGLALGLLAACSTAPVTVRPQARPIGDERLLPVVAADATLRERIIDIALQEWRRWGAQVVRVGQGQACVVESGVPATPEYAAALAAAEAGLAAQQPCLRFPDGDGMEATESGCMLARRYWHLLGRDPDCRQITEARWAWSAAFISWVMRRAGLNEQQFLTGQAHSMYVTDARDGILPEPAYRVEAFPAMPTAGDMICSVRDGVQVRALEDISFSRTPMHCDIVIDVDEAGRSLRAIGGNVQQSVSMSLLSWEASVTASGHTQQALVPEPEPVDVPPDESVSQPWLLVMRFQLR